MQMYCMYCKSDARDGRQLASNAVVGRSVPILASCLRLCFCPLRKYLSQGHVHENRAELDVRNPTSSPAHQFPLCICLDQAYLDALSATIPSSCRARRQTSTLGVHVSIVSSHDPPLPDSYFSQALQNHRTSSSSVGEPPHSTRRWSPQAASARRRRRWNGPDWITRARFYRTTELRTLCSRSPGWLRSRAHTRCISESR
ncbi:hypothetical protein L227DRAFT_297320 [Lentinus tigrinus ALCF2SS1-6]|uniref:Uncharacterized protein n=1 Tax=Lentinus tigrinus ALCF2SS1-6 TaxID=1328759 RepID=A0A5C2RY21_9APHY|nr:hypothetical protein L227DRAFT_297320 [Lentinus tigrinus ALCF2SS1-6]